MNASTYRNKMASAYAKRRRQHQFRKLFRQCVGTGTITAIVGTIGDGGRIAWKAARRRNLFKATKRKATTSK